LGAILVGFTGSYISMTKATQQPTKLLHVLHVLHELHAHYLATSTRASLWTRGLTSLTKNTTEIAGKVILGSFVRKKEKKRKEKKRKEKKRNEKKRKEKKRKEKKRKEK
jgi:hypothetical protein